MPDLKNIMLPEELVVCEAYLDEDTARLGSAPFGLLIGCNFSAMTAKWPDTFKHLGRVYSFEGQEPLGPLAGMFAGCAKYKIRKEYECYLMDPSKKMAHLSGAPLFASDSLGLCCDFIYKKFDKDGIPVGVYQPRTNSYRDYYGVTVKDHVAESEPVRVTMTVECQYGKAELFAAVSGPGIDPFTSTMAYCLKVCQENGYIVENAQDVLYAINEKGEFSSRS